MDDEYYAADVCNKVDRCIAAAPTDSCVLYTCNLRIYVMWLVRNISIIFRSYFYKIVFSWEQHKTKKLNRAMCKILNEFV